MLCVCVRECMLTCVCAHACHGAPVKLRGQLVELILSFYMDPEDQTQIMMHGGEALFSHQAFLPAPTGILNADF